MLRFSERERGGRHLPDYRADALHRWGASDDRRASVPDADHYHERLEAAKSHRAATLVAVPVRRSLAGATAVEPARPDGDGRGERTMRSLRTLLCSLALSLLALGASASTYTQQLTVGFGMTYSGRATNVRVTIIDA